VESGLVKTGVMYEAVQRGVPFVLAGSIRDDGPLVDVVTDTVLAQKAYLEGLEGAGCCLMLASALHSIAVGNLLPARVRTICVDMVESVPVKLGNRGSMQAIGLVTDVGYFLERLRPSWRNRALPGKGRGRKRKKLAGNGGYLYNDQVVSRFPEAPMKQSRVVWGGLLLLALATLGCQWVSDLIPASPSASPGVAGLVTSDDSRHPPQGLADPDSRAEPDPESDPEPGSHPGTGQLHPARLEPGALLCGPRRSSTWTLDASITGTRAPRALDLKANCEGCYYVKDGDRYHEEVGRQLGLRGYCAYYDGDEIGIKNQNSFNEQYDILLAAGYIRRGQGTYMGTCRPAWF
jgi:hypothetical protein